MASEATIAKLALKTGEQNTALLNVLYDDTVEWILAYTNRKKLPAVLEITARELTVITYNRLSTEGESGRSEGGESYSFETAPASVRDIIDKYRLARVGGVTHEYTPQQD